MKAGRKQVRTGQLVRIALPEDGTVLDQNYLVMQAFDVIRKTREDLMQKEYRGR